MSKATNRNITKTNTNKIHARAFQYYKDTKTKKTKLQIYKWPIEASHPIKHCTKEGTLLQGLVAPDFPKGFPPPRRLVKTSKCQIAADSTGFATEPSKGQSNVIKVKDSQ